MWTVTSYLPVALFSLKAATATSSGGKTLLVPTPFALKMALLDAALRTQGQTNGERLWPIIRDLRVQIALPERLVVINTFTKIVRPKKHGPSEDHGSGLITPLNRTIAYREYVHYGGAIGLALQTAEGEMLPTMVAEMLLHITYLGKRGGFVQVQTPPASTTDEAIARHSAWVLLSEDQTSFPLDGTLQMLDDCAAHLSFAQVNIYSGKRMALGKDRIVRHIVLPYRLSRSSRGFSLYERIAND